MSSTGQANELIIDKLRKIGIEIPDATETLSDIEAFLILKATAKCLNLLSDQGSLVSKYSPDTVLQAKASVSARYSLISRLANDCKILGLPMFQSDAKGGIFLNGTDSELQQLFLFLLDMMPQHENLIERLAEDEWNDQGTFKESEEFTITPDLVQLLPKESRNAAFNLIHRTNEKEMQPSPPMDSAVNERNALEALRAAQLEYRILRDEIIRVRRETRELCQSNQILEDSLLEKAAEHKRAEEVKKWANKSDESIQTLEQLKKEKENKIIEKEENLYQIQMELDAEYEDLLQKTQTTANSDTENDEFERRIIEKQEEIEEISKALVQLTSQDYVPRSDYTRRLLDFSAVIAKQKNEAGKVVEDVKIAQKEIHFLEGKLQRTITELEMRLNGLTQSQFKNRFRKFLTALYEKYDYTIEMVRTSVKAKRDIRDLQMKIDEANSENTDIKLKMLQDDLDQIRLENDQLKKDIDMKDNS